jgi:hypothetical protein
LETESDDSASVALKPVICLKPDSFAVTAYPQTLRTSDPQPSDSIIQAHVFHEMASWKSDLHSHSMLAHARNSYQFLAFNFPEIVEGFSFPQQFSYKVDPFSSRNLAAFIFKLDNKNVGSTNDIHSASVPKHVLILLQQYRGPVDVCQRVSPYAFSSFLALALHRVLFTL